MKFLLYILFSALSAYIAIEDFRKNEVPLWCVLIDVVMAAILLNEISEIIVIVFISVIIGLLVGEKYNFVDILYFILALFLIIRAKTVGLKTVQIILSILPSVILIMFIKKERIPYLTIIIPTVIILLGFIL